MPTAFAYPIDASGKPVSDPFADSESAFDQRNADHAEDRAIFALDPNYTFVAGKLVHQLPSAFEQLVREITSKENRP